MRRKSFYTLVALLMAGASITGCVNDDGVVITPEIQKIYALTVEATKGADTRTLTDEGNTLSAQWNTTDEVAVYKGTTKVGTLTPDKAETTAKLKGEVMNVSLDDVLTLKFSTPDNFDGQKGTLEYIDKNCNYAEATVTVTNIVNDAVTTTNAEFAYQQSITKFTFDKVIKEVYIIVGSSRYGISLDEASKVVYVALPPTDTAQSYTFEAYDINEVKLVGFAPKPVKLEAGKFYTATIYLLEYAGMEDYNRQDEQNW